MRRTILGVLAVLFGLVGIAGPGFGASDFDDGTLQGWSKHEPFHGDLENHSGGNPGGFLFVGDTMAGGGGLVVVAPPWFSGDIGSCGLEWDEYLFDCDPTMPTYPRLVCVEGPDTTIYMEADPQVTVIGAWHHRALPFAPEYWTRVQGTADLAHVLRNLTELRMSMDCNTDCYSEAGIDNFDLSGDLGLPPDPARCTVEPWDQLGHAFVTPGQQWPGDVVTVTVANQWACRIGNAYVHVALDCSNLCLNHGDSGMAGGWTNAQGILQFSPMAGGCEECEVIVVADGVAIRTFQRIVSTDWDGQQADGRVDDADMAFFSSVYGTTEPCADYDGDGTVDLNDLQTIGASYNRDVNFGSCVAATVPPPSGGVSTDRAELTFLPNPARSGDGLGIGIALPRSSLVRLDVFNAGGVRVATICEGERGAGLHRIEWIPRHRADRPLESGIYFLRLSWSEAPLTRKLILLD